MEYLLSLAAFENNFLCFPPNWICGQTCGQIIYHALIKLWLGSLDKNALWVRSGLQAIHWLATQDPNISSRATELTGAGGTFIEEGNCMNLGGVCVCCALPCRFGKSKSWIIIHFYPLVKSFSLTFVGIVVHSFRAFTSCMCPFGCCSLNCGAALFSLQGLHSWKRTNLALEIATLDTPHSSSAFHCGQPKKVKFTRQVGDIYLLWAAIVCKNRKAKMEGDFFFSSNTIDTLDTHFL